MRMRWLLLVAAVVLVVMVVAYRANQPEAVVDVVRPQVGPIRAYVEERAVTELPHDTLIAMPISGWLERITLREGDPASAGQVVARLETADLEDAVTQAEHRIAVLETRRKRARDHRLEEHALVEARATVKAFDETVKAAEAKLEASRALLEFRASELARLQEASEAQAVAPRELRAAETELRRARANYQSDALELAALRTLHAVSYIGPTFIEDYIDRKSFDLQEIEAQLAEARADLEMERRNLNRAEMVSPIDGVVLHRHQTRRQYLQAGTPLLTLGRLAELEVIAEVLTERATRIEPGDEVEIFGEAMAASPARGRVLRVYPAGFTKVSSLGVEEQRVNVAIALAERPPRLGVGFRVYVRIFHDQAADALTIPRLSLFRGAAGQWQVMRVREGVAELVDVKVGITNDERAQILEGLGREDRIIARPSRDIVPGMQVAIVEE